VGWYERIKSRIKDAAKRVVSSLKKSVKKSTNKAKKTIDRVVRALTSAIKTQTRKARDKTSSARSKARDSTRKSTDRTRSALQKLADKLTEAVRSQTRRSRESVDRAKNRARESSSSSLDRSREAKDRAKQEREAKKDRGLLERFFPGIGLPGLDGVKEAVAGIAATLINLPSKLGDEISDRLTGWTRKQFQDPFEEILPKLGIPRAEFYKILDDLGLPRKPSSPAAAAAVGTVVGSLVAMISGPVWDKSRQLVYDHFPTRIPSVSDLVRFELREVFRPSFRRELLREAPSSDFLKWMKKQGYDKFWAESYWAAHWDLPSITQGFEMFHRLRPGRVPPDVQFTRADLERLLKQQDVLPFYRPRLTAIAYLPITRVDIRRMYRLGVIDEKEVEERYKDLGYSPEDAKLLAEYTIKDVGREERAVSKSDLVKLYVEGLIPASEFRSELRNLGYKDEDVERLWRLANIMRTRREKKEERGRWLSLSRYEKMLEAGLITEAEFKQRLVELGFSPQAILDEMKFFEEFRAKQQEAKRERVRRLSLTQMTKAYKEGIISEDQLRSYMAERGYAASDIDIWLTLVRRGQEAT